MTRHFHFEDAGAQIHRRHSIQPHRDGAGGPKTSRRELAAKFQSAPAYVLPVKGAPVMPVDNLIERYAGLLFFKIQNDECDVVAVCKELPTKDNKKCSKETLIIRKGKLASSKCFLSLTPRTPKSGCSRSRPSATRWRLAWSTASRTRRRRRATRSGRSTRTRYRCSSSPPP